MKILSSVARGAALALVMVLLGWLVPGAAWAEDPMRLDDQLTDESGVLDGRRGEAQAALDSLRRDEGLQLFVVFVPDFDGMPAQDWADETAVESDLGDRDALLAVATRDRAYAYSFDLDYPLTDAQLAEVAEVAIEPALGENDWAGAVVAAADGYRAVLNGQDVPTPRIQPGEPDEGGSGGSSWFGWLCLLVPVGGVIVGGIVWWRRRRQRAEEARVAAVNDPDDPHRGVPTEELANRANALLIEVDNEIRASEREVQLATGEYGAEATATYTAALEFARREVAEAFKARLALDERESAPEPERRGRLAEIIRRCTAADERLDAEVDAFEALRALEANAEQSIATLGTRRAELEGRLPAAATALEGLTARYTAAALTAVAGNVPEARERLAFAGTALGKAGEAVTAGRRPEAALAIRATEEALTQAETLLDAVTEAGAGLAAARTRVDALIAEVESGLAAARAAQATPGAAPELAATLAGAVSTGEQALTAVRAGLAEPKTDPVTAEGQLETADAALDQALGEARTAAERAARAKSMLDSALASARSQLAAADNFIATRRGAVGDQARAWVAEAGAQLAQAESLATRDPSAALTAAQNASRLASQATRSASADVGAWAPPGGGFAGGGAASDGFLGGILGGMLSGGGHYGGSWGGGGWGGSWGSGYGGSRSRSRRSSWGGSRSRRSSSIRRSGSSRRSGGSSRRSGGGRRGGGGRF